MAVNAWRAACRNQTGGGRWSRRIRRVCPRTPRTGGRDAREDCLPTYRAIQSLIAYIGEADRVAGAGADRTQSGPGGGHEDAGSATTDLVPGDDEEAMAKSQKGSRVESLLRA